MQKKLAKPVRRSSTSVKAKRKPVRSSASSKAGMRAPPVESAPMPVEPCVVGVGASAGGFEATSALLEAIPRGAGLAVVVVQHMDPHHKSMAKDLLARRTRLTVTTAVDGAEIRADHVYTIPADRDATIVDGKLRLQPVDETLGLRLPIDRFFYTLGAELREKAIGVVLSGTGSDGSLGIKSIIANGGIVLVQDPATAQYDGMPRSAAATGIVSHILPIARIAEVAAAYAAHPYATGDISALLSETDRARALQAILDTLRRQRAEVFASYKRSTMQRRIERRMSLRRIQSIAEYAALIRTDSRELDALAKDMLIGVTEFFRDPDAWNTLAREVIEPLVQSRAEGEAIRAWVPGTSTGEEAYTLTILIVEALQRAGKHCPVHVFGTDANHDALKIARAGRYAAGIASQVSPPRLRKYFTSLSDANQYQVTPEIRERVVFGPQDLFSDPPFSRVDIVSCRNVLIYLEPEAQRKVILLFHFSLRPGGHLFLGTAESIGSRDDLFECVSKQWQIHRRIGATPHRHLDFPIGPATSKSTASLPAVVGSELRIPQFEEIVQRAIVEHFAPAAVLANEKLQAVYFCGPTERFLSPPRGRPTHDVLSLVGEGLRSRLRAVLKSAATHKTRVVSTGANLRRGRSSVPVVITVTPISRTTQHERLFLIVFTEASAPAGVRKRLVRESPNSKRLEDELRITRDDLQSTVDQLQDANQELMVSHEDSVANNEELRSINEELESSKEELQSLNEELHTVNQQLQSKVAELGTANEDLTNLLRSSDIVTICLDRDLCVRWQSPATSQVVNILATDVGRPISVFASSLLGQPMIEIARAVIGTGTPSHDEVQSEKGRCYLRGVLPYRGSDGSVIGVIVTLTDITESKQAAAAAAAEREALLASLEQRVGQRTEQLRTLAFALSMAEERERRNVASDLHDDLGQVLALVKLKMGLLKRSLGAGHDAMLQEIEELIETADDRVHSLVFQLTPPLLHELGLPAALGFLADEMKRVYGLTVNLDHHDAAHVADPIIRTIVFRAVRELLINVARHAKVTETHVECLEEDENLRITVSDDGEGFDVKEATTKAASGGRFGLANVRERLEFVGGKLDIRSIPGDGTEAIVTLPLVISAPSASPR